MFDMIGSYDEAWKAIISPARQDYNISDLGPAEFAVKDNRIKRTDFRLLNNRGHILECSFFEHVNIQTPVPCVVYLHGNGCSRMEAMNYLDTVLSQPISFFCFDFSGCGKSDGQYTSIGWHEQDDLDCIIQYLFNSQKVSRIGVWGRSMGAITALLYAQKDPRVKCFIFDSPFSNFKQMIKELVKAKAPIPEFLVSGALKMIRKTVLKKADFDIDALKPAKFVDQIKIPALFGAAREDALVSAQHTRDLFNTYGGLKELLIFEGDHNSKRPDAWKVKAQEFIRIHLLENVEDPSKSRPFKLHFSSQQNAEESTFINLEKDTASPIRSHYLPKPLKQVPVSSQEGMNFSWLRNSHSGSTQSSDFTTPQKENVTEQKRAYYFPTDGQKDSSLNGTPKSANLIAEPAQIKGSHFRRAATSYMNVRESYESSKLAAKDCLSPPDFHRVAEQDYTRFESSGSPSINDVDSLRYSGARSEDIIENHSRRTGMSLHKHSATLKDISSFGLNGSSDITSAGLDSSKSVNLADLKVLTTKPLMSDLQFSTSPEFVKSPDLNRVSSGSYSPYQSAGPFHKKNMSNVTHAVGTRTSLAEDSSPAVKAGHHTQKKKSVMLKVRLNLDTPIISATAQTARTSMADFLARNLCPEESIETKGRESMEFTSKAGTDIVRMKC